MTLGMNLAAAFIQEVRGDQEQVIAGTSRKPGAPYIKHLIEVHPISLIAMHCRNHSKSFHVHFRLDRRQNEKLKQMVIRYRYSPGAR